MIQPDDSVVPAALMQRRDVKPSAKLVWACIQMRQGRNASAWPNVVTIAADAGLNRTTVMDAITELETAGLLVVTRVHGRGSRYQVVHPATPPEDETTSRKLRPVGNSDQSETPTTTSRDSRPPPVGNSDQTSRKLRPVTLPSNPSSEPFQGNPPPQPLHGGSKSPSEEGEEETPLGGQKSNTPAAPSLTDKVHAQLALTATPGSAFKLLALLSDLHCGPNGAPHIQPGVICSAPDRELLASVIQAAEAIGKPHGIGALEVIAGEWVALIALAAAGELPPVRNAVAYFAKRFGDIEKARAEGAYSVPGPAPRRRKPKPEELDAAAGGGSYGCAALTTDEDRLKAEQTRLVALAAVADVDEQARLHARIRDIAAERRRLAELSVKRRDKSGMEPAMSHAEHAAEAAAGGSPWS